MTKKKKANAPHIEIKTLGGVRAEIFVNGKKLEGVMGYQVVHKAGQIPKLLINMRASNMDINGAMIPVLPEIYRPFYAQKELEREHPTSDK